MQRPFRACVPLFISALLGAGLLSAGCGSDDSNPAKPAQPTAINGNVNKAPIDGATVNVYTLNPDGSRGPLVAGPFTTDASGNWNGTYPAGAIGPFTTVSTGGSYSDEATSVVVTVGATQELEGLLAGTSCSVTPLTHATFLGIQAMVAGGTTLAAAIPRATSASTTAFGFDLLTTTPSDAATATASQKKYAALLGGLSTLIEDNFTAGTFASTPRFDLVLALATDLADGQLDGLDASGGAIDVATDATGTTTAPLTALSAADLSAWLTAANAYAASQTNLAGISFNTATAWNPSSPPPGSGGGGGVAGTIVFTGSGRGSLAGNTSCHPDSSYLFNGPQYVWKDTARHIEITIVPADQALYPGKAETVYVVYSGVNPSVVWNTFAVTGVPGVSFAHGKTTFADVFVQELTSGGTNLSLNGTLQDPLGSLGSVDFTTAGLTPPPFSTITPDTSYIYTGSWRWEDRAHQVLLIAVPADQIAYPGAIQTVIVVYNTSHSWTAHGVSGVVGVSTSGGTTTFDNTLLVDLNTGTTSVRLTTGTLTNP